MPRYLDHPFHFDGRGRAAVATEDDHVFDLIGQVLFTSPGERVNRPDFGCGLRQLTFMPNSDALATATQFLVQGALQRWLGDLIDVERVRVSHDEGRLSVDVAFRRKGDNRPVVRRFVPPGAGGF
ncbi:MAG: GPW/gp25 family protein [Isosphaeraceae bacterium]